MHARLDRGAVKLLTRTGLDWTHKYPPIAAAVASLPAAQAYLDGELCGVFPDGITSFGMIQAASDAGNAAGLVFFIFDLLHLDGDDIGARPLIERKARLAELLSGVAPPLHYSDYHRGQGPLSTSGPARWRSRASSPNALMQPMRPATAACGSR
jgi:ATP-dependent DNA ligase